MFSAVASDLSTVQIVPSQSCGCGCAGDNCVVVPILAVEVVVTDCQLLYIENPEWVTFIFGLPVLRTHRSNTKMFLFFFFPTYSAVCKVNALSVFAAS